MYTLVSGRLKIQYLPEMSGGQRSFYIDFPQCDYFRIFLIPGFSLVFPLFPFIPFLSLFLWPIFFPSFFQRLIFFPLQSFANWPEYIPLLKSEGNMTPRQLFFQIICFEFALIISHFISFKFLQHSIKFSCSSPAVLPNSGIYRHI